MLDSKTAIRCAPLTVDRKTRSQWKQRVRIALHASNPPGGVGIGGDSVGEVCLDVVEDVDMDDRTRKGSESQQEG